MNEKEIVNVALETKWRLQFMTTTCWWRKSVQQRKLWEACEMKLMLTVSR
jgi:hypothetical protein